MSTITISSGTDIQKAIDSAPSGSTIVFKPGVYDVSQVINLKSGVSLEGQPGAVLQSNGQVGIFKGLGVHDVSISGFTFDGNNGGPADSGAIYLDSSTGGGANGTPSNNIHISNNTFQNWTNNTGANLWLWQTQNTYVQGNTFKNGFEAVAWSTDPNAPSLDNLVVSNNDISGMKFMGIETAFSSAVSNVHIDYNNISNIGDTSISFVEGVSGGEVTSGTVWGNHIDGANSGGVLLELGNFGGSAFNVTVSQNVLSNHDWGMNFSHTAGMAVLNNTFNNVDAPFSDDGGYDQTEWIGTNTIDGAQQTGWDNHNYGTEPTLFSPSSPGSDPAPTPGGSTDPAPTDPPPTGTSDGSNHHHHQTSHNGHDWGGRVHPHTVLQNAETTANFSQGAATTSGTSNGGGSQVPRDASTLAQLAGKSLGTDLTNVGNLDKTLAANASQAGVGVQQQPINGIGAALSTLDQNAKPHHPLNADAWHHA